MRVLPAACAVLLMLTGGAVAASDKSDAAAVERGRRVFERQCAPCHGDGPGIDGSKMLPGTAALAAKYDGALPAELTRRSDLDAETLKFFVRNGSGAMPMFRKVEISDADLEAVAAYLAETSRMAGGGEH